MKKLIYLLFVIVLLTEYGYAQSGGAQRQQMTPEQRLERMAKQLGLNDVQKDQVAKIEARFVKETNELRDQVKETDDPDKRREVMKMMRSSQAKRETEIRELLTPTQQEKFDEMKKRREEMRKNRQRRRGSD